MTTATKPTLARIRQQLAAATSDRDQDLDLANAFWDSGPENVAYLLGLVERMRPSVLWRRNRSAPRVAPDTAVMKALDALLEETK